MHSTNYNGSLQHYPYAYEKFGVTRVRQQIYGEEYLTELWNSQAIRLQKV